MRLWRPAEVYPSRDFNNPMLHRIWRTPFRRIQEQITNKYLLFRNVDEEVEEQDIWFETDKDDNHSILFVGESRRSGKTTASKALTIQELETYDAFVFIHDVKSEYNPKKEFTDYDCKILTDDNFAVKPTLLTNDCWKDIIKRFELKPSPAYFIRKVVKSLIKKGIPLSIENIERALVHEKMSKTIYYQVMTFVSEVEDLTFLDPEKGFDLKELMQKYNILIARVTDPLFLAIILRQLDTLKRIKRDPYVLQRKIICIFDEASNFDYEFVRPLLKRCFTMLGSTNVIAVAITQYPKRDVEPAIRFNCTTKFIGRITEPTAIDWVADGTAEPPSVLRTYLPYLGKGQFLILKGDTEPQVGQIILPPAVEATI